MTMIYFCGRLDYSTVIVNGAENQNPDFIGIRGYDAAGNTLSEIPYGIIPVLYQQTVSESGTSYLRSYFDAVLADGTPVLAYTRVTTLSGASGYPIVTPLAVAAAANGHVYSAATGIAAFVDGVSTTVYAGSLRKFRRNGDRMAWPEIGGEFRSLALDSSENLYAGGFEATTTRYFLRKFDADGAPLWSVAATGAGTTRVYAIALDGAGALYAVGAVVDPATYPGIFGFIRKYDATTGALVWDKLNNNTAGPYDEPICLAISSGGRIYTAGVNVPIAEWDSSGTILRSSEPLGVAFNKTVASITITGSSLYAMRVYGPTSDPLNFKKYSLDLALSSETAFIPPDTGNYLSAADIFLAIASTDAGDVVAAVGRKKSIVGYSAYDAAPLNGAYHFHAWDSAGAALWTGKTASGRAGVDKYGNAWPSGLFANDLSAVYRSYAAIYADLDYSSFDGTLTGPDCWYTSFDYHPADFWTVRGVAVVESTETPAIGLPVGIGIPTWIGDRYSRAPGIPLALSIRAPRWIREFAGAFPPPSLYRLFLTGDTGPIELPLGSFQCRRTSGSLSLSVVCPGVTEAQLDAIALRTDGDLVIYRGLKFSSGAEQSDEMIRAALATPRVDQGSARTSISLDGESSDPVVNAQTRTLRGISYRAFSAGKRRVRCAVDTWLAPGDTADLGAGETLIVASIVYTVSPDDAVMEVAE